MFRETKVRNRWTVLLGVLNWYVRMKIRVETFGANHSVTDRGQINRCFNPETSRFYSQLS